MDTVTRRERRKDDVNLNYLIFMFWRNTQRSRREKGRWEEL